MDLKYDSSDASYDKKVKAFKVKLLERSLTLLPITSLKTDQQRKSEEHS